MRGYDGSRSGVEGARLCSGVTFHRKWTMAHNEALVLIHQFPPCWIAHRPLQRSKADEGPRRRIEWYPVALWGIYGTLVC